MGLILLIDDDRTFARDLRRAVGGVGRFAWLPDAREAIRTIRVELPQWILVDLDMPRHLGVLDEEEGLELVLRLTPAERARVIVVTQALSARARRELGRLGVRRFYLKSEPYSRLLDLLGSPWSDGRAKAG